MRWTWYAPALAAAILVVSAAPALALRWSAWDDDDWQDDDFFDDLWDDDDFWDDDFDSIFDDDDDWFDSSWRHGRHRLSVDLDSDLGSLVLFGGLGDGGCVNIQTLVLLDAIDDGRLSQRDLRELALVRHLIERGVVHDACLK